MSTKKWNLVSFNFDYPTVLSCAIEESSTNGSIKLYLAHGSDSKKVLGILANIAIVGGPLEVVEIEHIRMRPKRSGGLWLRKV